MKKLFYVFIGCLNLPLVACQSTSSVTPSALKQQAQTNQEQAAKAIKDPLMFKLVSDVIREKLSKNGPAILCTQENYLNCYSLTEQQCLSEVAEASEPCLEGAFKDVEPEKGKEQFREIGKYYGACIAMKHVLQHPQQVEVISACLSNFSPDKNKLMQTLFK